MPRTVAKEFNPDLKRYTVMCTVCPFCSVANMNGKLIESPIMYTQGFGFREVQCPHCESKWEETFMLVGINKDGDALPKVAFNEEAFKAGIALGESYGR